MTTYERRRAYLNLLAEQGSLKVTALAHEFGVSEGTVRNDLSALEEQDLLRRVRGGAAPPAGAAPYPLLNKQAQVNGDEKKRIARWAAELVGDGDVILLDASSTVLHMAPFLKDRKNLTVVTNGLETAQFLARDSSREVILVGGTLKPDGSAVTGSLSRSVLEQLHIGTAFVSCSALSLSAGLMASDIDEAAYKRQVISSASRVVALLDSSKIGKVGLKPFASLADVDHLVTDDRLGADTVRRLSEARLSLTLCGEDAVQSLGPRDKARRYKIGFANLSEQIPFAVDVRRGLERAAKADSTIDLVVADNDLDGERAVRVAEHFIEQSVDLVVEYQIDEACGNLIMNRFVEHDIPVIAVDIPMVGASFFGVDNFRAGLMAGEALGYHIKEAWGGELDALVILEEARAGALPAARIQGQLQGLQRVIGAVAEAKRYVLDSGSTAQKSHAVVLETLHAIQEGSKTAFLCFNDDAALGALEALREVGRSDTAAVVGQGADRRIREELRAGSTALVGSTSFNPNSYGEQIIALALRILSGQQVPPAAYVQHQFVSSGSVRK